MRACAAIAVALVVVAGCATVIPHPTQDVLGRARIADAPASMEELTSGRELYVAKCSGCHQLYVPSEFSATKWRESVAEMGERAKITLPDQERIRAYLETFAKAEGGLTPRPVPSAETR